MDKNFKSALFAFSALSAIAFMPSTALAQSVTAQPASFANGWGKSQAILGGAPSRLAAILAEQQGLAAPARLRPASLSKPTPTYAVLSNTPRYSLGGHSGRPDVFGSVALSVNHTPLDWRWRKVAGQRVGGAAAAFASSLRGRSDEARLEAVNHYVNGRVQFVDDSRQYGHEDVWAAASDTLRRGRGDCEDYAIAKLQMLRLAGVSDRDLYLVIARDLVRRTDHALLVVRAGGRMFVLDNGTNRILNGDQAADYRPVLTFSASGAWTHGYRRPTAPLAPTMTMAAATMAPLAPSAAAPVTD